MQSSLVVGDEVMLTSGIYGVLQSLDDERVSVQIAPGVVVEVARGAVGQRVSRADDDKVAGAETESPAESTGSSGTADTTETRLRSAEMARRPSPVRTLVAFFLGVAVMFGLVALAGRGSPRSASTSRAAPASA